MPYAVAQELPGVSVELYHRLIAETGGHTPQGLILRAVGPHEGNLRMIEVWESKEARQHFIRTGIEPARQRLGGAALDEPPHDHFELDVEDLVRAD